LATLPDEGSDIMNVTMDNWTASLMSAGMSSNRDDKSNVLCCLASSSFSHRRTMYTTVFMISCRYQGAAIAAQKERRLDAMVS